MKMRGNRSVGEACDVIGLSSGYCEYWYHSLSSSRDLEMSAPWSKLNVKNIPWKVIINVDRETLYV